MNEPATLYEQVITPDEGNDTITIPRRFYGQPLMVSFTYATPELPQPAPRASPRLPNETREEFAARLKIPPATLAKIPILTKEQIDALGKSPRMQKLDKYWGEVHKSFPPNITRDEIREMRLKEKYGI
jgi:hypothetical protein